MRAPRAGDVRLAMAIFLGLSGAAACGPPAGMKADGTADFSGVIAQEFPGTRDQQERQYQQMYSQAEAAEADLQAAMSADTDAVKQSSQYQGLVARNQALTERVKRTAAHHDELIAWANGVQTATEADFHRLVNEFGQLDQDAVQMTVTVNTLRGDHEGMVRLAAARR